MDADANTQDKILHAVETLVFAVNRLVGDVADIKKGQAGLEETVAQMGYEHGQKLNALFDKMEIIEERTSLNAAAF